MKKTDQLTIEVCAHWQGIAQPTLVGRLFAAPARGKEIFSFEYDDAWLRSPFAQSLDPSLQLYQGRQFAQEGQKNFGAFLDSSPDTWGRVLMRRREAQAAREEKRTESILWESEYLLGVYDGHRPGGLRFRTSPTGPFLDDNTTMASPPWTSLRDLEYASLQLEKDGVEKDREYSQWLRVLLVPGGSLGGARPKASVLDERGCLWIAKFPSQNDEFNVGAWEHVIIKLAERAQIETTVSESRAFTVRHHTFLTKRFDRTVAGERLHFASAMTLLQHLDGDNASTGVSYLELAKFITQGGARPDVDLEQLWRRIVFFVCVSNTDDHLRNHGFILQPTGWVLSPAYDMNPSPHSADGLKLNISETDNAQSLDLVKSVAQHFRVKPPRANEIISEVVTAVKGWRKEASALQIPSSEQDRMERAFRAAERVSA